jgi:hypothetical protein
MAHCRCTWYAMLAAITLSSSGCYSPYMRWPDLYHPGPARYQRAVADKFDPYPSPETGPEVVGGRPLGYQRPLTETEWGRRYAQPDGAFQPVAAPAFPGPPVFTTPYPPAPPAQVAPFQVQPRSPY